MAGLLARYAARLGRGRRRETADEDAVGPTTSNALTRAVAEGLYHESLRAGGWAAEIGFLGPESYLDEARWVLNGIALGAAASPIPTKSPSARRSSSRPTVRRSRSRSPGSSRRWSGWAIWIPGRALRSARRARR
jgi:hypothetical protein